MGLLLFDGTKNGGGMILGKFFPLMRTLLLNLRTWVILTYLLPSLSFGKDTITNPFTVKPMAPPLNKEEVQRDFDQSIDRMREKREKQQKLDHPVPTSAQIKAEQLFQEASQERPHRFHMQVSLVKPFISVQSPRKKYQLDLTSHSTFFFRPETARNEKEAQFWTGFRLAPFSGTGTYDNVSGRFGFTYFGPMIGVGKINEIVLDSEKNQEPAKGRVASRNYPSRFGFFAMTGLAFQSRETILFAEDQQGEKDFEAKKFAFDSPGLWGELTFSSIFYEAVSANVVVGFQMGEGKLMGWGGIAMGAWY